MTDEKLLGNDDKTYTSSLNGNYLYLAKHTAIKNGVLKSIRVKFNGVVNARVALYSDNSNYPGSLLSSNENDNATVDGVTTITIPDYTVVAGTVYWIAVNYATTGAKSLYNSGTGQTVRYKLHTYGTAFPSTIPSSGYLQVTAENAISGWGVTGLVISWGGSWGG